MSHDLQNEEHAVNLTCTGFAYTCRKKSDKLDWMYMGQVQTNEDREEYLLGKAVTDKTLHGGEKPETDLAVSETVSGAVLFYKWVRAEG